MTITPKLTPGDLHPEVTHNIIENLPEFLKHACLQFTEPTERELFLYSALGVLSGCLPNYLAHYDGWYLSPNLYVYVLAPYGTGKGSMMYARYLGDAIDNTKKNRTYEAMARYRQQIQAQPKRKKGSINEQDTCDISVPPIEMLYCPGDSSKSALIDFLFDNKGYGMIFETEGDTLTTTLKQEYAAYRDLLNKAFHHEPVSFMRRLNKEHKEVKKPRLALILSSTYDQFLSLIDTTENGLVSRFAFYLLNENKSFRNVFADEKECYREYFTELGKSVERKYNYLYNRSEPVYFFFTNDQKVSFHEFFSMAKEQAKGLTGIVNRLAVICYRIAMILAFFRHYDYEYDEHPPERIMCDDKDFTNALAITGILHDNAETVHGFIPAKTKGKRPGDIQALFDTLPDEFTTQQAIILADKLGIGERKTNRYLGKEERLDRVSHGHYKKKQ